GEVEYGSSGLAGAVAVPGAVLVELEACGPVVVEWAVDLAGAIRGHAGERLHVLGGWDGQKQRVQPGAAGSAGRRQGDGWAAGRVVEAIDELVEVVSPRPVEFDQLDRFGG